jgi:hypothetical protein
MLIMTTLRHILLNLGRGWLVIWVLLVPLIHIHPDIGHTHGAHGHVHSAQYHSVISEDHSYEFHTHSHSAPTQSSPSAFESIQKDHVFDHVYYHPEIGFSILKKSEDDPLSPPGPGGSIVIRDYPNIKNIRFHAEIFPSGKSPLNRLLVSQPRIRPPPFLSL